MKTIKFPLLLFSSFLLIAFSNTAFAQESKERTPEDAFEWLSEKMELFEYETYSGSGRWRFSYSYKYKILGFEGCTVKIEEDYDKVRSVNSTKDDIHDIKEWTINFADVGELVNNTDANNESYPSPRYTFKSRNSLDKFQYNLAGSDYKYSTNSFNFYVKNFGELNEEPQRLTKAFEFLIQACKPAPKVEKF